MELQQPGHKPIQPGATDSVAQCSNLHCAQANSLKNELSRKQQALGKLQAMYDEVLDRLAQQSEEQVALYATAPSQQGAGERHILQLT